jgi:hypothetical protein
MPMPFGASKDQKAFCLLFWFFFLNQNIPIILERMHTSSILSQVVMISLTISQLPPLHETPHIAVIDLLQTVGC